MEKTRRHVVTVDAHGDHAHVDVSDLPRALRGPVLAALADGEEMALVPLEKAERGEGPDPRFPEIEGLVAQLRASWERWASWLARKLTGATTPEAIDDAMASHEAGVLASTTGTTTDPYRVRELVDARELPKDYALTAPVAMAARHGLALDPAAPVRVPAGPRPPPERPLTPRERAAVDYASERAAVYMRRPVAAMHGAVGKVMLDAGRSRNRSLSEAERRMVSDVIVGSVAGRLTVEQTAQRLRDAVRGTNLTNDMERVAVTEIAFAHSWGAYVTLKASAPAGQDPKVYRIASPNACSDCRRIWGPSRNPVLYLLSAVEARENAGGNFGLPHGQWGPTIGPVHPRCCCPPLLRYEAKMHDAIGDAADDLRKIFGPF